jgi:hypothetical protein
MDQDKRTLDFLRLFVRHQQEIYAYILTLVPHVPIPAETRFLTLVTTCPGRADYSWVLFSGPFLEPAATIQAEAVD